MITKIKGTLVKKDDSKVCLEVGGICYEIHISKSVAQRLNQSPGSPVELVTYYFFQMEKNKCIPVLIGFNDDMEKDFFQQFTSVSGIGPRAALRAFDRPISLIARGIEEGDIGLLTSLQGIGKHKAKQIIAYLQGKVGRFLLIKEERQKEVLSHSKKLFEEAKQVLKRLGYSVKESDDMLKKVIAKSPELETIEDILNRIYYEQK